MTFSDRLRAETPPDAEDTTSPEYQSHLATFLSSLVFWQDLLEHCTSDDVKQTLLDHFQYLFLQQLLYVKHRTVFMITRLTGQFRYPSLLESSDIDGGSSVAVLTYLRHILESIDHPDLVRLTLQYLFGLQESSNEMDAPRTPIKLARRRKSQNLIARSATEDNQLSPDLFNLSDLIMASLRSRSQQTIAATLLILSAMLRRPHHRSLTTLLKTRSAQPSEQLRSIGGQEKEVDQMLSLAENIIAFQDLETLYEQYLYDNRNMLESHPCSLQFLSLPISSSKNLFKETGKEALSHRILTLEDPTFESLISLLDRFFENDIETNLGLTQVIIDLASCPYMRLEGWLLTSPSAYTFPPSSPSHTSSTPKDSRLLEIMLSRRHPTHPLLSSSPLLQTLTRLAQTIDTRFRRMIPSFDSHILSCRSAISPQPLSPYSSIPSSRSPSRSTSQPNIPATPVPSRLRPSDISSRNNTPSRGRQLDTSPHDHSPAPANLVSRLGHLQTDSLSRSPSKRTPLSNTLDTEDSRSPYRGDIRTGLVTPQKLSSRPLPIPPALQQRVRVSSRTESPSGKKRGSGHGGEEEEESSEDESESETGKLENGGDSDEGESEDYEEEGRIGRARARKETGVTKNHGLFNSSLDGRDSNIRVVSSPDLRLNENTSTEGDQRKLGRNNKDRAAGKGSGARGADAVGGTAEVGDVDGNITLGHLCTNVIILQEFVLELAAVVETRAGLFGEVAYF